MGRLNEMLLLLLLLMLVLLLLMRFLLLHLHLHQAHALFGNGVLLVAQVLDVGNDIGGALAETLTRLFPGFLVPHFKPHIVRGLDGTGAALGIVLARQESTGWFELAPEHDHLARDLWLLHLAASEVAHLVLVDQFAELDVATVIVGASAASQQHIVSARLDNVVPVFPVDDARFRGLIPVLAAFGLGNVQVFFRSGRGFQHGIVKAVVLVVFVVFIVVLIMLVMVEESVHDFERRRHSMMVNKDSIGVGG